MCVLKSLGPAVIWQGVCSAGPAGGVGHTAGGQHHSGSGGLCVCSHAALHQRRM